MATGADMDRLLWAVGEARRLRRLEDAAPRQAEQPERRDQPEVDAVEWQQAPVTAARAKLRRSP